MAPPVGAVRPVEGGEERESPTASSIAGATAIPIPSHRSRATVKGRGGRTKLPSNPLVRVAFATYRALPDLSEDDRRAVPPLREVGIEVVPALWDDPKVDWRTFAMVVPRSTWDYHRKPAEFLHWVGRPEVGPILWNPPDIVRWNSHKQYLLELAQLGLPVVPTRVIRRGDPPPLTSLLLETGWSEFVIKPAVGAAGDGFLRADRSDLTAAKRHLVRLLDAGDALIQPFAARVEATGERSFVFFDGTFSHAAEYPALLRSSERMARALEPDPKQLQMVSAVLPRLGIRPLYARIDLIPDDHDGWWLSELELIEPELLFRVDPAAGKRFAQAVAGKLEAR